jgi:hypothetical protein
MRPCILALPMHIGTTSNSLRIRAHIDHIPPISPLAHSCTLSLRITLIDLPTRNLVPFPHPHGAFAEDSLRACESTPIHPASLMRNFLFLVKSRKALQDKDLLLVSILKYYFVHELMLFQTRELNYK